MSLDVKLIETSTEYSLDKLASRTSTECPYIFLLDDFLYPPLLEKLFNFVTTTELTWELVEYQEQFNRHKISWLADSVIEETHIVIQNLTTDINLIVNKPQKFIGINIWKDMHPYTIKGHSDKELISSAMQIYLNSTNINLATQFSHYGTIISPK